MTKHENERLYALERRLAWLEERLEKNIGINLSFDQAEASALRWALKYINAADNELGGFSVTQKGSDD